MTTTVTMKREHAVLLAALTGACSSGGAQSDGPATPHQDGSAAEVPGQVVQEFSAVVNRDVDILFMVDNSLGTIVLQNKLLTDFPAFTNFLEGLPGGLPNLHIAVISSDLGAGRYDVGDIPACRNGGDRGVFRSSPRGACAVSPLNPGQTFISKIGGMPNYTGEIDDAFGCIAAVGGSGCGFEHQLASVLRALGADGLPAPAENLGFLRPNAVLAVILVTDEDDCSAPADSDLFDPASRLVSDPLGPLASYRCNEFGHLCGGKRPPRTPAGSTDLSGTCTSAEDGRLLKVSDVVARIKALKADPSKVVAAAIAGPPAPYVVKLAPPTLKIDPNEWPYVEHSCSTAMAYADPAVRIKDWVDAFGASGDFEDLCNDTFAPALEHIAQTVGRAMGPPCIDGKIVGGPAHPSCTAVDHVFNDQGMKIDTPLPACADNGSLPPCWELQTNVICGAGSLVDFHRSDAGGLLSAGSSTTVTCQVCQANDTRPACQ